MRGTPIVVVTDLDNAWANLFVPEPMVPRVKLGQAAKVVTDAGGEGLPGKVTFVSPKAEFTPRNVQTRKSVRSWCTASRSPSTTVPAS
jgi:HlyD family secretion protein